MIKVKSKQVQLYAFNLPYSVTILSTFSKGRLRTIYWVWWFIKIPIRKYISFTSEKRVRIPVRPEDYKYNINDIGYIRDNIFGKEKMVYKRDYIRIKLWQ